MGALLVFIVFASIAVFSIWMICQIAMTLTSQEQKAVETLCQASKYCIDNHLCQLKLEKERYTS
tara:strand:- start:117 stop:308 length:192 start_codon:yes stop_codon:yes gene_type:complete